MVCSICTYSWLLVDFYCLNVGEYTYYTVHPMVSMGMESSPMCDESQCGVCCSAGLKTGWQESTPSLDLKTKEHNGTVSYGEYLRQREKFIISIFIKCPGVKFCLVNA